MFVKYNYYLYLDRTNEWNLKKGSGEINLNHCSRRFTENYSYYVSWFKRWGNVAEPKWRRENNTLHLVKLPDEPNCLYILSSDKPLEIPRDEIVNKKENHSLF